jgi:ABC-type polysaccharide/polyol phosphate transport system ATPase subunit
LLKIISRVTCPTTGKIHIKGLVASLLEVGTGFHQEITGRENIFLNGAIIDSEIVIVDEVLAVGIRRFRKSV